MAWLYLAYHVLSFFFDCSFYEDIIALKLSKGTVLLTLMLFLSKSARGSIVWRGHPLKFILTLRRYVTKLSCVSTVLESLVHKVDLDLGLRLVNIETFMITTTWVKNVKHFHVEPIDGVERTGVKHYTTFPSERGYNRETALVLRVE